jgi:phosphohistidine phosphatase SixA
MLANAGVTAIYVTETDRARQTAEPLAKALKLGVRTYSPRDAAGKLSAQILLDRLKTDGASGTVLVVGHQNTVPDLIAELGHRGKIEIGDKEFDDLFVVVPKAAGPPAVIRLKY